MHATTSSSVGAVGTGWLSHTHKLQHTVHLQSFSAPPPSYCGYLGFGGVVPFSSLSPEQLDRARVSEGVMTISRGNIGFWETAAAAGWLFLAIKTCKKQK
jgi:hypothetical protein